MALAEQLKQEVAELFAATWSTRNGTVVPETDDLKLGNDAVVLEGTVLYADLAQSTNLVDVCRKHFAAEMYKAYLHCASKIIRSNGGVITAFDGDRVMAVYLGDRKNSSAARTARQINYAVLHVINPAIKKQYPNTSFELKQAVGVDTSELWIARTGIRGSNDLVWVGRAANYAAKLCSLRSDNYASWITADVYNKLIDTEKYYEGKGMWEARSWTTMNGLTVYRSSWWKQA